MNTVSDGENGGVKYSRDTTGLSGGQHGYVNTCLYSYTITGKDQTSFEWTALARIDNYSTAGENCAHYAQGNKFGTGPTWARTAETCSTESIPGAQITDEVDVWVSGPNTGDKGCSDLTVGDGKFIRGLGRSETADAHFAQRRAAPRLSLVADLAAELLDQGFADTQPQPGPAALAGIRRIRLSEFLEDALLKLNGDPISMVRNRNPDATGVRLCADLHGLSRRREFDGIRDQVRQHLGQSVVVGADREIGKVSGDFQGDVVLLGVRRHAGQGLL